MTDNSPKNEKNPFQTVWNVVSVPMSVLGLLGISDALVNFHDDIQNIINSYKSIVHPVFNFLLGWLWFDIPTWAYDYMILGVIVTSCKWRAFWHVLNRRNSLIWILSFVVVSIVFVMIWPITLINSINHILKTSSKGIITNLTREPNPFFVKYNFRNEEVLVLSYFAASILIFILVLILNYTFLMRT